MELTKTHISRVSVWKNKFEIEGASIEDLSWISLNHETIYGSIKENYENVKTVKAHVSTLSQLLLKLGKKDLHEKYKAIGSILKKEEDDMYDDNIDDNPINYGEILGKREELRNKYILNKGDNRVNLKYLYLCMVTYQPPLRNDYKCMEIINKEEDIDKTKNYLLNDNGKYKIILNKDKESKKYGSIKLRLNNDLNEKIRDSLENYPRKYLFPKIKNPNVALDGGIIRFVTSIFDPVHVTIRNIRSAYITNFYKKISSNGEKIKLAKLMRHSKETAQRYYNKLCPGNENKKIFDEKEAGDILKCDKYDVINDIENNLVTNVGNTKQNLSQNIEGVDESHKVKIIKDNYNIVEVDDNHKVENVDENDPVEVNENDPVEGAGENDKVEEVNENDPVEVNENDPVEGAGENQKAKKIDENQKAEKVGNIYGNQKVEEVNDNQKVEEVNDNQKVEEVNDNQKVEEVNDNQKVEEVNDNQKVEEVNDNQKVEKVNDNQKVEEVNDNQKVEEIDDNKKAEKIDDNNVERKYFNPKEYMKGYRKTEKNKKYMEEYRAKKRVDITRKKILLDLNKYKTVKNPKQTTIEKYNLKYDNEKKVWY
jgi:hypothetical protein